MTPLERDLQRSLQAAHTSGTKTNHHNQARLYLRFMLSHHYDPYNPSEHQAQLYAQFLANTFQSTQAIKNYLSGVRTFLKDNGVSPHLFSTQPLHKALKGMERLSTHVPSQAPELTIAEIKHISHVCRMMGPTFSGQRAALLIMFATFIRQSNSTSIHGTEMHTILTQDINLQNNILWITIRSSKTVISPQDIASLPIYPVNGEHCPVTAWFNHRDLVPRPPLAPAFLSNNASPLQPLDLLKIVRLSLEDMGSPRSSTVTLHSLRRSGSCHAARGGATVEDVRRMGIWRGSSVHTYVPKKLFTTSAKIIASSLAD